MSAEMIAGLCVFYGFCSFYGLIRFIMNYDNMKGEASCMEDVLVALITAILFMAVWPLILLWDILVWIGNVLPSALGKLFY